MERAIRSGGVILGPSPERTEFRRGGGCYIRPVISMHYLMVRARLKSPHSSEPPEGGLN